MTGIVVIGIDPGLTGAFTAIGDLHVLVDDIPTVDVPGEGFIRRRIDGAALAKALRITADWAGGTGVALRVFCEAVQVMPSTSTKSRVQTEQSLVECRGAINAVCDILGAPAVHVRPQEWQAFFGLVGKKSENRERGALPEANQTAARLFPAIADRFKRVGDHNRAESALIAHYSKRCRLAPP